jgi:hypothetical protein
MICSKASSVALASVLLSILQPVVEATKFTNETTRGTFTPAAFISAPRRAPALPNPEGTLAIYSTNTYNFTTASRKYGTYVLNLADGSSTQWTNSSAVSDVNWLSGNKILYLQSEDDGSTSIRIGDVTTPGKG